MKKTNIKQYKFIRSSSSKGIDGRLRDLVLRVEVKIALLRSELLKWFIGVSLIQTSTFIGVIIAVLEFVVKK